VVQVMERARRRGRERKEAAETWRTVRNNLVRLEYFRLERRSSNEGSLITVDWRALSDIAIIRLVVFTRMVQSKTISLRGVDRGDFLMAGNIVSRRISES
jgi:hypothetical protein